MIESAANWIATASAAISLISCIGSIWFSQRMLRISSDQEARKKPKLEIQIRNEWVNRSTDLVTFALHLRVLNVSESGNYFRNVHLYIKHDTRGGRQTYLVLESEERKDHFFAHHRGASYPTDDILPPQSALSGVLYFTLPRAIYDDMQVESYNLRITDIAGNEYFVPTNHFKEIKS